MSTIESYDVISSQYADIVHHDPSKVYVQYPWTIHQLAGEINATRILDIGCGEGALARVLSRKGALVCGYDNSIEQIGRARTAEEADHLGIEYIHADPRDIIGKSSIAPFNFAIAVTVLHYATDCGHLETFFSSTRQLLYPGGIFVALVFNPDFRRFNKQMYNRRYCRESNGRLRVDFFDQSQMRCSVHFTDFSRSDYESAASDAGWSAIEWLPVEVTAEGKEALGSFWKGFEEDCPYAGFTLRKPTG